MVRVEGEGKGKVVGDDYCVYVYMCTCVCSEKMCIHTDVCVRAVTSTYQ